jgi:hypothetical protein
MKHILLSSALLLNISIAFSQICDFEDLALPIDTYATATGNDTLFDSYGFGFSSQYDTNFNYWSGGFAMSTMRDTSTGDFSNLYSARTNSIQELNTYAVVNLGAGLQSFEWAAPIVANLSWASIDISNTTYAYKSMLLGDAFAKKFGGASGDDPDYFFLRIYAKQSMYLDSLDVYLADFRFNDNSQDFIIDDWTSADISGFPSNTQLEFRLFSSDTGMFGINTPLFFAIDNIKYSITGGLDDIKRDQLDAYSDGTQIQIQNPSKATYTIYDMQGRLLQSFQDYSGASLNIEPKNQLLIINRETPEGITAKRIMH